MLSNLCVKHLVYLLKLRQLTTFSTLRIRSPKFNESLARWAVLMSSAAACDTHCLCLMTSYHRIKKASKLWEVCERCTGLNDDVTYCKLLMVLHRLFSRSGSGCRRKTAYSFRNRTRVAYAAAWHLRLCNVITSQPINTERYHPNYM